MVKAKEIRSLTSVQKLAEKNRATIITTGFNQQIATVLIKGRYFIYQRINKNFILV